MDTYSRETYATSDFRKPVDVLRQLEGGVKTTGQSVSPSHSKFALRHSVLAAVSVYLHDGKEYGPIINIIYA